jgi:hypothetical protein
MLTNVLALAANVLLPATIFCAWLAAEFRGRTFVRIGFGIACMAFPFLWIWSVIYSADALTVMHNICLHRIELLLEDKRETQVLHAIQVYEKTYKDTDSAKRAVFQMSSVLSEAEEKWRHSEDTILNREKKRGTH